MNNTNVYCTKCKRKQDIPLSTPHIESDRGHWTETEAICRHCGGSVFYLKPLIDPPKPEVPPLEYESTESCTVASAYEFFMNPDLEIVDSDVDMISNHLTKKYPNCLVLVRYNNREDNIFCEVWKPRLKED